MVKNFFYKTLININKDPILYRKFNTFHVIF